MVRRPTLGRCLRLAVSCLPLMLSPERSAEHHPRRVKLAGLVPRRGYGEGSAGQAGLKDRIEALGGRIWIHSPPGAGTTLQIALPLSGPTRSAWES
jgi:hypothetical protein